jgi:hypothetical protein
VALFEKNHHRMQLHGCFLSFVFFSSFPKNRQIFRPFSKSTVSELERLKKNILVPVRKLVTVSNGALTESKTVENDFFFENLLFNFVRLRLRFIYRYNGPLNGSLILFSFSLSFSLSLSLSLSLHTHTDK